MSERISGPKNDLRGHLCIFAASSSDSKFTIIYCKTFRTIGTHKIIDKYNSARKELETTKSTRQYRKAKHMFIREFRSTHI
jgi:hypothetical protein